MGSQQGRQVGPRRMTKLEQEMQLDMERCKPPKSGLKAN